MAYPPVQHPVIGPNGRITEVWLKYLMALDASGSAKPSPLLLALPAADAEHPWPILPPQSTDPGAVIQQAPTIGAPLEWCRGHENPWPPFPPGGRMTADEVAALGYWSPLMTGGGATSEMVLTPDGDAIMAWTATP